MLPPALTRYSQAAEMMGVAAQHSQVPAEPLAPSAVAEVLELIGLVEIRPAEEATEQNLWG